MLPGLAGMGARKDLRFFLLGGGGKACVIGRGLRGFFVTFRSSGYLRLKHL